MPTDTNAHDIRHAVRLAVLIPDMNVALEHDWTRIRVPEVCFHTFRVPVPSRLKERLGAITEDDMTRSFEVMGDHLKGLVQDAARQVTPAQVVFPLTSETGWFGVKGAEALRRDMQEWAGGLPVTLGVDAMAAGLKALGVKRISMFAPYPEFAVRRMARFYEEAGFEIANIASIMSAIKRPEDLATISPALLRETITSLDGPDVDAIVQGGAALTILSVTEDLARELNKPVLALNPTTLWYAARNAGVQTRVTGFGPLWRDH